MASTLLSTSIMLYGAPIWAEAVKLKTYAQRLNQVYRLSAVRVACAFRTISSDAVSVIAGMPPITMLAEERERLYNRDVRSPQIKRAERETTIAQWQQYWDQSEKGRWTHRLIPSIDSWMNRRHGEVDHYLTQFLSDHGCFRAYYHRFKIEDSPFCPECKGIPENAEHVFFHCPRFVDERQEVCNVIGSYPTVNNIIETMIASEIAWGAIKKMTEKVMVELRRLERLRNSV